MNQAILLESNADNIDFMIHGIFSIKVFGQEVWIYHIACLYQFFIRSDCGIGKRYILSFPNTIDNISFISDSTILIFCKFHFYDAL